MRLHPLVQADLVSLALICPGLRVYEFMGVCMWLVYSWIYWKNYLAVATPNPAHKWGADTTYLKHAMSTKLSSLMHNNYIEFFGRRFAPSYFYFSVVIYLANAIFVWHWNTDVHNGSNPFEIPIADFNAGSTKITEHRSVHGTHALKMTTYFTHKKRKKKKKKSAAAELQFNSCQYFGSPNPGISANLLLIKCESDGFALKKKERVGSSKSPMMSPSKGGLPGALETYCNEPC